MSMGAAVQSLTWTVAVPISAWLPGSAKAVVCESARFDSLGGLCLSARSKPYSFDSQFFTTTAGIEIFPAEEQGQEGLAEVFQSGLGFPFKVLSASAELERPGSRMEGYGGGGGGGISLGMGGWVGTLSSGGGVGILLGLDPMHALGLAVGSGVYQPGADAACMERKANEGWAAVLTIKFKIGV